MNKYKMKSTVTARLIDHKLRDSEPTLYRQAIIEGAIQGQYIIEIFGKTFIMSELEFKRHFSINE